MSESLGPDIPLTDEVEPSPLSPEPPPRTRVTLLRWMVLIAVFGVGFAWLSPVILPVILLPIAVAALAPRGATWFAIETSAAVGWLLAALVSFSEIEPDFLEFMMLFGPGLVLALSSTARIWRSLPHKLEPSLLITPLIGLTGLFLLMTDRDFEMRLAVSEPALKASAARFVPDEGGWGQPSARCLGLILVDSMEQEKGCTIWWIKGGFLDSHGVAYAPSGVNPSTIPGMSDYRFQKIRGPWWRVISPFSM